MVNKVKILVVPSDRGGGCSKFRSLDPHIHLQEMYPHIFEVDVVYLDEFPKDIPLDIFLKPYDIVHIHKQLDAECQLVNFIKFLDKKVVQDLDDYYFLGDFHPMSITAKKDHWEKPIIEHLKLADMVTTTTPIYRQVLLKHNKNVHVFPNAINPLEEQMKPINTKSNKLRFGIICGSTHYHDLAILKNITRQLPQNIINKIQFVLCGFDTNGTKTIINQATGEVTKRNISPQESVWCDYEKMLTDDYKIISKEHKQFLDLFIPGSEDPFKNEPYVRCWTKDIKSYMTHYDNIDVLLVPLKECDFNKMKSQLKVIEAGFKHKAIIAQNFGPYTVDLKSIVGRGGDIDETGNALVVDSNKNHKLWAKYIKMLVEKPELVTLLQNNLYETVKDTYSLDTVCESRAKAYLELVGRSFKEFSTGN